MSVRRWHWGKVAILWVWGGVVAALLLANFLSAPATEAPLHSALVLLGGLGILIALTAVTWIWLGGKETGR